MTRPTDEMLMAYADGELSAAEKARIAAVLDADAEARAAVESFRRTAELARAAFSEVLSEPVPDTIVRTVLGSETSTVIHLSDRRKRQPAWRIALRLAASLVVLAGVGTALLLLRPQPTPLAEAIRLGPVPPATPLAVALETQPSGVPVALTGRDGDGSDRLMAVATFRDRDARVCREVEVLEKGAQPRMAGVACRDPGRGTWVVEGVARVAAPRGPGEPGFVPSGAEEKDALEGLIDMLGAGRALTAAEERALMEKGWR